MTVMEIEPKSNASTYYEVVRPLAVMSKFFGAFPLAKTRKRDGRNLKHSWLSWILLWDLFSCSATFFYFVSSCYKLLERDEYNSDPNHMAIWLKLTCYIVTIRGVFQFILLHIYAPRLPKLFSLLEEFHQILGVNSIKCRPRWYTKFLSLTWTLGVLLIMELTSVYFFNQLCESSILLAVMPVALSYTSANVWKELPMNMFVMVCKYLTCRFHEVQDDLRSLRENGGKDTKDTGQQLERIRLQHAALSRIVSQLQSCYGMQLAANLLFLLLDTVLQLFFFFIVTESRNVILLVLALYYLVMTIALLAIVNQMEHTDEGILEEVAAFELFAAPREHQLQVQLFTAQLTARPVKISAAGFVTVNNALICSLTAAVATYIVMFVQFVPYIQLNNHHAGNSTQHNTTQFYFF